MGTVASLEIPAHVDMPFAKDALAAAEQFLHDVDARFSHYRPESEVSRYGRGELTRSDVSTDLDLVLTECSQLHVESNGVFSITNPRNGELDTAGYVKGWSIEGAASILRGYGINDFLLNVGGDVVAAGTATPNAPWKVAISDPSTPGQVCAGVQLRDAGVATSGLAERGEHIWNLRTGRDTDLLSFTVVGPSICKADAYATIGFAMGMDGLEWVEARGYHAFAVLRSGELPCTRNLGEVLLGQVRLDG